jgi:aspartokinase-like uncharacterized kinase
MSAPIVVKVGGSLYEWAELGPRLQGFLKLLSNNQVLLVPGGGRIVDGLRELDRQHQLGEATCHDLALRALSVSARFLRALLGRSVVVESLEECRGAWERGDLPILDCHSFLRATSERETALPSSWDVTSDSIAAYVARCVGAQRLVLLKSCDDLTRGDWGQASCNGFVDRWFPRMVGADLAVEVVNLREWQPGEASLPAG